MRPLLGAPPAVTFAMAWDDISGSWVSTIVRPLKFPLGQLVMTDSHPIPHHDPAGERALWVSPKTCVS